MNVLVSFESASLLHGLNRFEDKRAVKVAISLVFQWILEATHRRWTPEQVFDNIHQVIHDSYPQAEYMLGPNHQIDIITGEVTTIRYPLLHREHPAKNYPLYEYNTSHNNWYHRFAEIVEHLVMYYSRQVMGFIRTLERDKHAVSIYCLEYTDRYIAAVIHCRHLVEYRPDSEPTDEHT